MGAMNAMSFGLNHSPRQWPPLPDKEKRRIDAKKAVRKENSRPVTPLARPPPGVQLDRDRVIASDMVFYGLFCGFKIINFIDLEFNSRG